MKAVSGTVIAATSEWKKWHSPKISEINGTEARDTIEHLMRASE
jgi:hypothetical protein